MLLFFYSCLKYGQVQSTFFLISFGVAQASDVVWCPSQWSWVERFRSFRVLVVFSSWLLLEKILVFLFFVLFGWTKDNIHDWFSRGKYCLIPTHLEYCRKIYGCSHCLLLDETISETLWECRRFIVKDSQRDIYKPCSIYAALTVLFYCFLLMYIFITLYG